VKPGEEIAPVHLQGFSPSAIIQSGLENLGVHPKDAGSQTDLFRPPCQNDVWRKVLPEKGKALGQSVTGMGLVRLGPEEREEGVTAAKGPGRGKDKVGQEGKPLRLGEDWRDLLALQIPQIGAAQKTQLQQCPSLSVSLS
jgi:hypothetical protein